MRHVTRSFAELSWSNFIPLFPCAFHLNETSEYFCLDCIVQHLHEGYTDWVGGTKSNIGPCPQLGTPTSISKLIYVTPDL